VLIFLTRVNLLMH